MGTDIHYKFQKKSKEKDCEWVDVDLPTGEWSDYDTPFHINRSYLLFSVLAGVRNGVGFAGCYRHEPIVPISEPRGLPEDIKTQSWFDEYGDEMWFFGEHSQSWLLSSEILEYLKKGVEISHQGVISVSDYLEWSGLEAPRDYCGDVFGSGINIYDGTENILPMSEVDNYSHVRVQWMMSVNESLDYFRAMIQSLQDSFGEVRIVFGFDS